ncbi:hypothetical protein J4440_05845 [Candidatus Woesearchaeota archaeon]|nr:hypothetical protein [Candidatus Woesearchaeota archaeon]
MKRIILDTNFLIYCASYKIDLFTEIERICDFPYKLYVLDLTIKELEKVKPKNLVLIKRYIEKMEIINSGLSYVDDELSRLSSLGDIIATQDKGVKDKLSSNVIIIRKKKYLELK